MRQPLAVLRTVAVVCLLGGCATPGQSSKASVASVWQSNAGPSQLPAGDRAVAFSGGVGWVLSRSYDDNSLSLAKFDPVLGTTTTVLTGLSTNGSPGLAVAGDDLRGAWIASGEKLVHFDGATGQTFVATTLVPPQVQKSKYQDVVTTQGIVAIAAEPAGSAVDFLRETDNRLFRWSPTHETADVVATLPIWGRTFSTISRSDNGDLVVTGLDERTDSISAVEVTPNGIITAVEPGVTAAAVDGSTAVTVTRAGTYGALGQGTGGATVGALYPTTRLVVDALGRTWVWRTTRGHLLAECVDSSNSVRTVDLPLIALSNPDSGHGPAGDQSGESFVAPGVQGMIPDTSGGVWIVTNGGSAPGSVSSAYPTFEHVA